ncbi:glycosyltransferase family 2 protein [Sphingomonas mesophila]|uniref:glycosyltransferase family 2 protein n=1 Tax=Sphingomonas mesophila TaxID=2303576 RepID=UPI001F071A1F|nr:glycosyltransferase family 2 protein [Sphingomonas mesophila]
MTLAIVAATLLAIPALVFAVECLLGLRPLPPLQMPPCIDAPAFAVIVPAHDEADGIAATVAHIRAQLRSLDYLLVVADNCTDDTADQARLAGARVIERNDLDNVGKGYALAFGCDELAKCPRNVVIIIDADCRIAVGGLQRLALEAAVRRVAIQAAYLMESPPDTNALVAISSFAFRVRNVVRQRGLARLGAAALLQGTGMAFPWSMVSAAPLATDDIVEDLNLGIALLQQGHRIGWSEAVIVSSQPANREATMTQRTRWEHGSTSSAPGNILKLAREALRQRRVDLAILALDLLVPPLALLLVVTIVSCALAGILALLGTGMWPVTILGMVLAALILTVLLAWVAEGQRLLTFNTLLKVPAYVLWKLPIYARLLAARQKTWVRTARK